MKKINRPNVLFLCNFSNALVRERVSLEYSFLRTLYYKWIHKKAPVETDYAVWVSDYIEEFKNHPEFEFHIVAPIQGLKGEHQQFEEHGIYYHFYNCSYGVLHSIANVVFDLEIKRNYVTIRKRIRRIMAEVKPDLVILCGAENPYYSIGVLDVKDCPVYVILQTLLNSQKRIEAGVGNSYKRRIELEIFRHAGYFCVSDRLSISTINKVNPKAIILPAGFPTHRPVIKIPNQKDYDYVFFAKTVAPYKGIEDVLKAFSIVKKRKPKVNLNIIGGISADYQLRLDGMVEELGLEGNVNFAGLYPCIEDTYNNVAKARVVVVPGITGSLNSTVRESMLMGMPTICYELDATKSINSERQCLITAPMGNVDALAIQMEFAVVNQEETAIIASQGKDYALHYYGNGAIVNLLLQNCKEILKIK